MTVFNTVWSYAEIYIAVIVSGRVQEIMEAYFYAKYHPSDESNTKQTYTI